MIVVHVGQVGADLRDKPVAGDGVDAAIAVLGVLDDPLPVLLHVVRPLRRALEDVLREALPGPGAVEAPEQRRAVAAADQARVAPAHAVLVEADLEPGAQRLRRPGQHGRVHAALDAALEAVRQADELRRPRVDPDVLPGHVVAAVVVDVEAAPAAVVGVGDGHAPAAGVLVAPGQDGAAAAGPALLRPGVGGGQVLALEVARTV